MHLLERQSGCLDFTLAVVFLKEKIVVAVLQNTGTTAAETAEGRVAVSGYQISSTASMKHCRSSPGKQRSFDTPILQVFSLGFKWQKHPLKGNEQSFMKLQKSRCRRKLSKPEKIGQKDVFTTSS